MGRFRLSIYEPEYQTLINWLIEKRKEKNLTQRQLAQKLDVVHSLVGKVEKGERRLDVIEFINYCKALDISPNDFYDIYSKIYNS